jgi:hypothetical protein
MRRPAASPPSSRERRYRGKGEIQRIKRNRDMIERSREAVNQRADLLSA